MSKDEVRNRIGVRALYMKFTIGHTTNDYRKLSLERLRSLKRFIDPNNEMWKLFGKVKTSYFTGPFIEKYATREFKRKQKFVFPKEPWEK